MARIVTEAYLYDLFEEEGNEFVRTFASYQNEDDIWIWIPMCIHYQSLQNPLKNASEKMERDV